MKDSAIVIAPRFQCQKLKKQELARTENRRNATACSTGYGYCDRSLLTPAEVLSAASEHASPE
jgi:hypothetical protein